MTTIYNPHAGRASSMNPPAQGQGTDTGDAQSRPTRRRRQASVRNSGARHVSEVATWDTADSTDAGGMPGNGRTMPQTSEQQDMRIWSAYMIGYWHGIEAMKTAVPMFHNDGQPYGLPNLLRDIQAQERRDDE